jgi:hypothetical protein
MKSIAGKGNISSSSRNPGKFVHNAIAAISVVIQADNFAIVMKSFDNARP